MKNSSQLRALCLLLTACGILGAGPAEEARPPGKGMLRTRMHAAATLRLPADDSTEETLPEPDDAKKPPTKPTLPTAPRPGELTGEQSGLTLAMLEEIALSNNPTLLQANAAVRAAEGQYIQGGLPPNPNIGWSSMQMGDQGRAGQQGPYVEQFFVLGGKLQLNRATENQRVQQMAARREAQTMRVVNDVRTGYYNVLIAQRTLDLTRQLVEIGNAGAKTAEDLLKAEQVSRVDLLQARVEMQAARVQYQNARNRYAAAWRSLSAVLGAPDMAPAKLAGDVERGLPAFDWESSLDRLLASSPELAEAQAGVRRAQFALARARREPFPNADVQYFPQHDFGTGRDIHSVQAYLVVPLWNQNQGNIRSAEADLTNARAEVKRVELDLHNRLALAFERYANARQQVEAYSRQILPDARTSLDLVAAGYRQGEFGYLTLLTAQRTFFQTNLSYLAALQALRENTVAIEGLLLTGNLDQTPAGR